MLSLDVVKHIICRTLLKGLPYLISIMPCTLCGNINNMTVNDNICCSCLYCDNICISESLVPSTFGLTDSDLNHSGLYKFELKYRKNSRGFVYYLRIQLESIVYHHVKALPYDHLKRVAFEQQQYFRKPLVKGRVTIEPYSINPYITSIPENILEDITLLVSKFGILMVGSVVRYAEKYVFQNYCPVYYDFSVTVFIADKLIEAYKGVIRW